MELSVINIILVMVTCAMTAFISHMGMAVFHDGIRPVIPEYIEGRMHRTEMATIAFGLSVGFIASVGIGNALATNLLNPWLLFLATDIIGIASPKKWLAPILGGGIWGSLYHGDRGREHRADRHAGRPDRSVGQCRYICGHRFCDLPDHHHHHAVWDEDRDNLRSRRSGIPFRGAEIFYDQRGCMDDDGWCRPSCRTVHLQGCKG